MSKDPAVLFYTSDFLTGTSRFTDEQCGQYIRALCSQHQEGLFSKDELLQILKSYDSPVWKKFIINSEGLFYNERMQDEIEKRINYCKSKSHKGSAGRKSKSTDNHMIADRLPVGNHTDNDNDNDNEDVIKNVIEINPEYRKLSEKLKTRILERRQQKITLETLLKWDNDVRLMIDRDNRLIEQISQLIDECHDMEPSPSGFTWRNNILSMAKLREKWNEGKIAIGMNKNLKVGRIENEYEKQLDSKYGNL